MERLRDMWVLDGNYAVVACTAIATHCDANEPNLDGSNMEAIDADAATALAWMARALTSAALDMRRPGYVGLTATMLSWLALEIVGRCASSDPVLGARICRRIFAELLRSHRNWWSLSASMCRQLRRWVVVCTADGSWNVVGVRSHTAAYDRLLQQVMTS